jgi:hypothetical protein
MNKVNSSDGKNVTRALLVVGVADGDEVDVDIELDTEPRELALPPDFAAALDGDAKASRFFEGLSYSRKQRCVLPVE